MLRCTLIAAVVLSTGAVWAQSGPYTPQVASSSSPPGYLISPGADAAIPSTSPSIVEWASGVASFSLGTDANTTSHYDSPIAALGPAPAPGTLTLGGTKNLVSLGEDGSVTVTFSSPIVDGPGNDFAVFSNGFLDATAGDSYYAYSKFATVAVSSDGMNFFSLPTYFGQTSLFDAEYFDASQLYDIAGKYVTGFGTPFDLNELAGVSPLLNVDDVQYVRVTDAWDAVASDGNTILDDPESVSGFNFGGIAVLNDVASVPEPSTALLAVIFMLLACCFSRNFIPKLFCWMKKRCQEPISHSRQSACQSLREIGS